MTSTSPPPAQGGDDITRHDAPSQRGDARPGPAPRRGRPRDPGLDQAILDSAFAVMVDSGIRGFSVREVARRSGIPKSSIYRRWPTRAELIAAVLGRLSGSDGGVPDTGSVRDDLVEVVRREIAALDGSDGVLPQVALEARDDAELAPVVRDVVADRRRSWSSVLDRAARRGDLRGDVDRDAAMDLVLGPVWSRMIAHRRLDPADAEAIVDGALRGIARDSTSG